MEAVGSGMLGGVVDADDCLGFSGITVVAMSVSPRDSIGLETCLMGRSFACKSSVCQCPALCHDLFHGGIGRQGSEARGMSELVM